MFDEAFFTAIMVVGNISVAVGIRRLFYLVSPNETSFEKTEDIPDYLNEAVPFFQGAILLEYIICLIQGIPTFRLNDAVNSITAGLAMQLIKLVCFSLELVVYTWLYTNWRLVDLPWDSPLTWWIAFVTSDFAYYWFHRAAHEVNFIWAAHQTHHSSEDYNLTTALRQSITQHFNSVFVYVPLGLFVPPSAFFVHIQFNTLYQFWIHTEVIKSLGPLEYVLNCPSHHRVHHGRNPYCIDKNYGGTFIIWDRLFGTFQDETDEKVVYGLVHPLSTWDPIWAQICHYVYIAKTFWKMEGIKNKIFVLSKGPGWTPGNPRLGDPADIPEIEYPVEKYNTGLPLWGNIYIMVHGVVFLMAFQELTSKYMLLSEGNVLGSVLFLLFTITTIGFLIDNKRFAPHLELLRCLAFLAIDHMHTARSKHVEALPLSILGITRVIFSTSSFIWMLLFCRSEKIAKKEE